MQIKDLCKAYKYGLYTRRFLLSFSKTYGGKFFKIRRPLAVFVSALLDDKHQEMYKNTLEAENRKLSGNKI